MFVFTCPGCHCSLSLAQDARGRQVRCPRCNHTSLVQPEEMVAVAPKIPTEATLATHIAGGNREGDRSTFAPISRAKSEVPTEQMDLPSVAGYEMLGILGRGGMGVVYQARQQSLKRLVALKMILASAQASTEDLQRFRTEAETLARLRHPNIVQVFEVGEYAGQPFICLEYVEGGSLAERLREATFPAKPAAVLVHQLALAVHAAHQAGVIHRDLKPANVLLTAEGHPRITDFGLARRIDVDQGQTRTGTVMGTPSYMPPEQAKGEIHVIGPLADVYSLGAILYECLTGAPPFRGPTTLDTLLQVTADDPVPPRRLQPKVPGELQTISLKCLEKDPRRRYSSAEALADDLQRFLDGKPTMARPVGAWGRAVKWAKRRPSVATLSLLLLIGIVVGMPLLGVLYLESNNQRQEAETQRTAAEDGKKLALERGEKLAQAVDDEKTARTEAEKARDVARKASEHAQRQEVILYLDRGRNLCEQGETGLGMLSYARALELAAGLEEGQPLEFAARFAIASWRDDLTTLHATLQQDADVSHAFFSPQRGGKAQVLTIAGRRVLRLWDGVTGEPTTDPIPVNALVHKAMYLPDGKQIILACEPNQVVLHDANTGQRVGTVIPHSDRVTAIAYLPQQRSSLLLTGTSGNGSKGEIRVWDVDNRKLLYPPRLAEGPVRDLVLRPQQREFISLESPPGDRAVVRVWDLDKGEAKSTRVEVTSGAYQLQLHSPTNRLYIIGGAPHVVYDLAEGKLLCQFLGYEKASTEQVVRPGGGTMPGNVGDLAPNGRVLGHGTNQFGSYYLRRLPGGDQLGHPMRHGHGTSCVISPDGRLLLTASDSDRSARLWSTATSESVGGALSHPAGVQKALFSPDGRTILTRSGGSVRLWHLPSFRERTYSHESERLISRSLGARPLFSPDGRLVFAINPTGVVWMDLPEQRKNNQKGELLEAVKGPVSATAVRSSGSQLAVAQKKMIFLVDWRSGKVEKTLEGHSGSIVGLAFSPDGQLLAGISPNGEVRLWDVASGNQVKQVRLPRVGKLPELAFTRQGTSLLCLFDKGVILLSVPTLTEEGILLHPTDATAVAVDPDGQTLWTGSGDGSVRRWDLRDRKTNEVLFATRGEVNSLAISPDGRILLTGTTHFEAALWSSATGQRLGPAIGPFESGVTQVVFAPDGKHFAMHGHYDATNVYRVPVVSQCLPTEIMAELQVQTGMELSPVGRGIPMSAERWLNLRASLNRRP